MLIYRILSRSTSTMITSIANNAAAPRQVACHTSDHDEIPVDLDVLRLSKTFIGMCDELGLEEHGEFPGIFPVPTISTFIFERVIWWCKKRKGECAGTLASACLKVAGKFYLE